MLEPKMLMKVLMAVISIQLMLTPVLYCQAKEERSSAPGVRVVECETRGTWLWASAIDSPEKRAHVLELINRARLNTLFLAIPSLQGNYGHGERSAFEDFIKRAVAQGVDVHAWFTCARRPGRGKYADFRTPAEQRAQAQWVDSVMDSYGKYLTGAHLDYIRFTRGEAVNADGKMDGVTATIRGIREMLNKKHPGKYLSATCQRLVPSREESNTGTPAWFSEWYAANPGSIYHDAVYARVPMHMKYQQNPVGWLKENIVDAVMPMQYSILDTQWKQSVNLFKSFNQHVGNNPALIYMGLGWIPKPTPGSQKGYDAAGIVRKIKYGRSVGMKGFIIFLLANQDHDDTPLINALTGKTAANEFDPPFENPVPSCFQQQRRSK